MEKVTYLGVLAAAKAIEPHLPETPAWSYPALDDVAGARVVVKHENAQPTGAFKVRGGINLALGLTDAERAAGVVTCSTGNHAQSIAYGARLVGARAVIVMPETAPAENVAHVRGLGAEVRLAGRVLGEAGAEAHRIADEQGMRFVSPGEDQAIVHGHATVYLELFRRHPDLEAVYVPAGSGTGAAGACVVRDVLAPDCRIVAVQSEAAPAAYRSWREGRCVEAECSTRVSGLATGKGFELPQSVIRGGLHDFRLVSDDDITRAGALLAIRAHTLAEGAGAAALAGLLADEGRPRFSAVVCTGGNANTGEIGRLSATAAATSARMPVPA